MCQKCAGDVTGYLTTPKLRRTFSQTTHNPLLEKKKKDVKQFVLFVFHFLQIFSLS
uniref:Uncharacterized protein n=1 Tax=Octopus bimaculoides TaxID=37653 RepID=A0A0L8GN37_OCTBM